MGKPYAFGGAELVHSEEELEALRTTIQSKEEFYERLLSLDEVFTMLDYFEDAFDDLDVTDEEFADIVENDLKYYMESINLGLESINTGVKNGYGTTTEVWSVLN